MTDPIDDLADRCRPVEASFVTTEHFALQGARSATIAVASARAATFLGAVSGGLVALGLIAAATGVGVVFLAFGLVLLPTLAFLGLVTFDRTMQTGIEDHYYARRIAHLRGYYFRQAPGLAGYLQSVPPEQRLKIQGLPGARRWQGFLTVAGMVAVITGVLAGAAVALLAQAVAHHSLLYALVVGLPAGVGVIIVLLRAQHQAWTRALSAPMFADDGDPDAPRRVAPAPIDRGYHDEAA